MAALPMETATALMISTEAALARIHAPEGLAP